MGTVMQTTTIHWGRLEVWYSEAQEKMYGGRHRKRKGMHRNLRGQCTQAKCRREHTEAHSVTEDRGNAWGNIRYMQRERRTQPTRNSWEGGKELNIA